MSTQSSSRTPAAGQVGLSTKLHRRLSQQLEASRDDKWRREELAAGAQIVAKLYAERGRDIFPADMQMATITSAPSRIHQDLLLSGMLSVWTGTWRERRWNDRMAVLTPRGLYLFKPNPERTNRFGPISGAPSGALELSKELYGDFRSYVPIDESSVVFEMFAPSVASSNSSTPPSSAQSGTTNIKASVPIPLPIFQISRPGKARILCRAPTVLQATNWVKTLHGIIQSHKRALAEAASIHSLAEAATTKGDSDSSSSATLQGSATSTTTPQGVPHTPAPGDSDYVPSYSRFEHTTPFYTTNASTSLPSGAFPTPLNFIPPWAAAAALRSIHTASIVATPSVPWGPALWEATNSLVPTPSIALIPPALLFQPQQILAALLIPPSSDTRPDPKSSQPSRSAFLTPNKLAYPLTTPFGRGIVVPIVGLPDFLTQLPELYASAFPQRALSGNSFNANLSRLDLLGDQLGFTNLLLSIAFSPSSIANEVQIMFEGTHASVRFNLAPLVVAALLSRRLISTVGATAPALCVSLPIVGWSGEADLHVAIDLENIDNLPYAGLDALISSVTTIPTTPRTPGAASPRPTSPHTVPAVHRDPELQLTRGNSATNATTTATASNPTVGGPAQPSASSSVQPVGSACVVATLPAQLGEQVRKRLQPRLWLARANFLSILLTLTEFLGVYAFLFPDCVSTQAPKDAHTVSSFLRRCLECLFFSSSGRLSLGLFASAGTSLTQSLLIQRALSRAPKAKSGADGAQSDASNQDPSQHQDLISFAEDAWVREISPTRGRLFALIWNCFVMLAYAAYAFYVSLNPPPLVESEPGTSFTTLIMDNGGLNRFAFDCLMLPFALFFFARGFSISRTALHAINVTCLETVLRSASHPESRTDPTVTQTNIPPGKVDWQEKDRYPPARVPASKKKVTISNDTAPIDPAADFQRTLAISLAQTDPTSKAQAAEPRLKITFIRTVDSKSGGLLAGVPFDAIVPHPALRAALPTHDSVADQVAKAEISEAAAFFYQCELRQREDRRMPRFDQLQPPKPSGGGPIDPETKTSGELGVQDADEFSPEASLWLKLASADPCSRVFEQSEGRAAALIRTDGVAVGCANQLLASSLAAAASPDALSLTSAAMVEAEAALIPTASVGVLTSVTAAAIGEEDSTPRASFDSKDDEEGSPLEEDDEVEPVSSDGTRLYGHAALWDIPESEFHRLIGYVPPSTAAATAATGAASAESTDLLASVPSSATPLALSSDSVAISSANVIGGAGTEIVGEDPKLGPIHKTPWGKWCQADWHGLKLRGPEYLTKRIKIPALQHRFDACFCEIWACKRAIKDAAGCRNSYFNQQRERAEKLGRGAEWAKGTCLKYMVVNMLVPGSPQYNFVMYFRNPDYFNAKSPGVITTEASYRSKDPFVRLMQAFVDGDDAYRTSRFKYIPNVVVGGWVLQRSVGNTPVILGNKLAQSYYSDPARQYIEIDVDVSSSKIAGSVLGVVKGSAKKLEIELNFLLEPHSEDELPEALWGGVRVMNVDLDGCIELPLVR